MPENVKVVNNYDLHRNRPPKTNSSYKIEVENPHYEMSANFAKSCSVSGLAAIHKNINLSRLPTSKTNYNLNKHPSTVKESMLQFIFGMGLKFSIINIEKESDNDRKYQ